VCVTMKVISYNVRGLGGGEKRVEVRRLVNDKHPFVLCIQESKLGVVDDLVIKSIWGDAPCRYSYQPSVGASGGLCVCGDFNSVRTMEEKKGRGTVFKQVDADSFNAFIDDNFLIDLPICGRLFTWFRGDGVSMSRLDRFLLSAKWCDAWPNYIQVAYQKGLSDHVPLLLHVDEANWGPRLLCMLKCWADFPGYDEHVRNTWESFNFNGWGGFVLR